MLTKWPHVNFDGLPAETAGIENWRFFFYLRNHLVAADTEVNACAILNWFKVKLHVLFFNFFHFYD